MNSDTPTLRHFCYSDTPTLPYPDTSSSFTLIEMMVVMGIIVIFAAFLYPAVMGARKHAKQKVALTATHNITLALKAYRCEYSKWPDQAQATGDATYVTNNYRIIRQLTGSNERGKIFLSIQTNMLDRYGNYVDPWGVPYLICMDEDGDVNLAIRYDFSYSNQFSTPGDTKAYSCVESNVGRVEAGTASFGDETSISIRSWDEIE